MKCTLMERWILLAESGELSPTKIARLERHIAVCGHCAAYRKEAAMILKAAADSLPSSVPDPAVMAALRRAARAGVPVRRGGLTILFPGRRQWLAIAATLLVGAAVWVVYQGGQSRPGLTAVSGARSVRFAQASAAIDEGLADLTMLAATADVVPQIERLSDLSSRPDVSLVERELMILEGLAI